MADERKEPKERKMLVETTGDFMFTDATAGQDVQPDRPSVVKPSVFIMQKVDAKALTVLEKDFDGTDEDFAKAWAKDPERAHSKSKKVKAAVAAREAKQSPQMGFQSNMDKRPGVNDPNRNPDTLYDTANARETFKARVEGDGTDADKARNEKEKNR